MTESAHPDPTAPDDTLVLPAELRRPRPVAWAELVALLRELLLHWGLDPRAVAAIAIDGELAAPDITRLALTASGISLPSFEEQTAELLPEGDLDEVAGCLEELHLAGDDLRWETARFSLAAQLRGLPFHWLMRGGQLVGIRFPEQTTEAASGWLRLDAELDSLVEAIRRTIERHLRPHGGQLRKLRVRAAELGDRRYRVQVDAAGRWKAFPLSARLAVTATLDDDLTVRFTDVQASSLNPLCAVALLLARRHIEQGFAEPVALRETLGPELTDLTLRLQPRLLIEASFAGLR